MTKRRCCHADLLVGISCFVMMFASANGVRGGDGRRCERGTIDCGATASGSLQPRDCSLDDGRLFERWWLVVRERQHVRIDLGSPDYDAELILQTEDCVEIDSDDDSGPRLDARLSLDLDPGTYSVVATQCDRHAGRAGDYRLEVSCREVIDPRRLCAELCTRGELRCGDTVVSGFPRSGCERRSAQLGQQLDIFQVTVTEPSSQLTVNLDSPDFDSFLELYDADCDRITFDDDGGGGIASRVIEILAPGTYSIGVSSFSPGAAGIYVLSTSCTVPFDLCSDCDVGRVRCGERLVGEFPRSVCRRESGPDNGPPLDLYPFELAEPGTLTIDLVGDFDPVVQLYTDDCVLVGQDDDSGDGINARLIVEVAAGRYRVGMSSFEGDASGSFELDLACDSGTGDPLFFRGDADADGSLGMGDAFAILFFLFVDGTELACRETADTDNDGAFELADAVDVLHFLFVGGPAPAPPGAPGRGRLCGPDPDPHGSPAWLGCEAYPACP